jgi:3'-phosphoadenosine 5'-phosphosulfate sulfotransferase (PAPS reductase)/FAD synthetase
MATIEGTQSDKAIEQESHLSALDSTKGLVTALKKNIIQPSRLKIRQVSTRLTRYFSFLEKYHAKYIEISGGNDSAYILFLAHIKEHNGETPIDLTDLTRVWRAITFAPSMVDLYMDDKANESTLWYASADVQRHKHVDLVLDGESLSRSELIEKKADDMAELAKTCQSENSPRMLDKSDIVTWLDSFVQSYTTGNRKAQSKKRTNIAKSEAKSAIRSVLNSSKALDEVLPANSASQQQYKAIVRKLGKAANMAVVEKDTHVVIDKEEYKALVSQSKLASRSASDAELVQLARVIIKAQGLPIGLEQFKPSVLTIAQLAYGLAQHVEVNTENGEFKVKDSENGQIATIGANGFNLKNASKIKSK